MMKRFAIVTGFMVMATASHAGVNWYTSLGGWQSAAGTPSFTENFSGFKVDTQFRTAPIAINGGLLGQEGSNSTNFRNLVEVSPFEYGDNNGTSHASMFTDFRATTVRMEFTLANRAFGFESWQASGAEGAVLEVYNGATLLGSQTLTDANGAFTGFVLDGGNVATSVVWRSLKNEQNGGEGFGIDNLVGVNADAVPEPFTMALLGMGALAAYGRKKKQAKI